MSTNNNNQSPQRRSGYGSQPQRQSSEPTSSRQRRSSETTSSRQRQTSATANSRQRQSGEPTSSNRSQGRTQPSQEPRRASGKKPPRKRSTWKIIRNILLVLLVVLLFAGIGAGIGAYLGIIKNAPKLEALSVKPGTYTSIMVSDTTGEEIERFSGDEDRIYVPLEEISVYMQNAAIAIEDERFREHNGIDIKGTFRSIYQTILQGSTQGGSTITQQVIKNHLGYTRNTVITKLQEQYLAVKFEKDLTESLGSKQAAKDYILELYLNTIALGHGLNGVETASNYYFDKSAKDLTLSESCVLASVTQNPSYYAPDSYPENNIKRASTTLEYMLEQGLITQSEYMEGYNDLQGPVYVEVENSRKIVEAKETNFSYFTDQVISSLIDDFMAMGDSYEQATNKIYREGITIYATQDLEMQKIVDEAMLDDSNFNSNDYRIEVTYKYDVLNKETGEVDHYYPYELVKTDEEADAYVEKVKAELAAQGVEVLADKVEKVPQPQASFVIIENGTGRVVALSGGRGEKTSDRTFNRATQALRQPGSVFKIFASFAPAIDTQKATAATVFDDVPNVYKSQSSGEIFRNWYKEYRGLSTIREGVRDSMNIVAVKTMQFVGVDTAYEYLENYGFTSLDPALDKNLATALGGISTGVSNLETTAAMASIENGGTYVKPIYYSKVVDHDGNVLIDNTTPETRQVMSPQAAYVVTDMMYDVVYGGGTGGGARLNNSMPVAGKTGTTSDSKDLTFVAYTPYLTGGVFMGYDHPRSMNSSNKEHITLWKNIMNSINELKGYEVKKFTQPDGIVSAYVCSESGELATDLCALDRRGNTGYTEIFVAGTEPTTSCSVHQQFDMCLESKQVATEYCPTGEVATKVGIVRPVPFETDNPAEYPADRQYEISETNICTIHNAENDGNAVVEPELPEGGNTGETGTTGENGGTDPYNPLLPPPETTDPTIPSTDPNANNNSNNGNSSGGGNNSNNSNNSNSGNSTGGGGSGPSTGTGGGTTVPTPPPETVPDFVDPLGQ